jgi:hypothetical protein
MLRRADSASNANLWGSISCHWAAWQCASIAPWSAQNYDVMFIINLGYLSHGARGIVVGWGTMLQDGRSPVRVSDEVDFFNLPTTSNCTMALGSTQPLTEMSTRNLPGGKKRPARRADNLAAICEPNVWKMWEPQPLTTLRASTACTGITLPLLIAFQLASHAVCYSSDLQDSDSPLLQLYVHPYERPSYVCTMYPIVPISEQIWREI